MLVFKSFKEGRFVGLPDRGRRSLRNFIRIYSRENEDGCWIWELGKSGEYGTLAIDGKSYGAHRLSLWAFEKLEDIDDTVLVSRHQCGNKLCVNPNHLEVGDQYDNFMDSVRLGEMNPAAVNFRKKMCAKGHVFDGENTIFVLSDTGLRRECKACKNL